MLEPQYGEIIFRDRYALDENESWEQCCKRVASAVASVESEPSKWVDKFAEIIYEGYFIPGGRILRNAGRHKVVNLLNCFGLVCEDSIENIAKTLHDAIIIQAEGGGIGINFNLRPAGAPIKRKGGVSSGVVSFMEVFNAVTNVIETGGSRRGAMLAMLRADHPDVLHFIRAKSVEGRLSNFNISVAVTQEFIEAVRKKEKWPLQFGGKVYQEVNAYDLWMEIITNMVHHGEPGIINFTNLQINNSYYCQPIETVNACSEIPLERYGACLLGALVLPRFVKNKKTDWKKLEEVIHIAVRFLDDVLDLNYYFLPEIEHSVMSVRRMGLGTMGLADYFFSKEIRYGSLESIREIDRLYSMIWYTAYEASIKIAEEKGSFPKFDAVMLRQSKVIKRLPKYLQHAISVYGLRNVALTSAQPTGTTSLLVGVTSGIEPLFAKGYRRKDRISERVYIHPLAEKFIRNGESFPHWFVSSADITPAEHLKVQTAVQKYLDGSTSKTINFPAKTSPEEMSEVLLEYIDDLKGVTVYVDGSREEQVLYYLSEEEIRNYVLSGKFEMGKEERECKAGVCEL